MTDHEYSFWHQLNRAASSPDPSERKNAVTIAQDKAIDAILHSTLSAERKITLVTAALDTCCSLTKDLYIVQIITQEEQSSKGKIKT